MLTARLNHCRVATSGCARPTKLLHKRSSLNYFRKKNLHSQLLGETGDMVSCLPWMPPLICLASYGLRAMHGGAVDLGPRWHRAPFLEVLLSLVRVCVLFRKTWHRRLPEDEIRFSHPAPIPAMCLASSEGVWRCVYNGSRGIWLLLVYDGSTWIQSLFVWVRVSTGWILPIYASLHRRQLLFVRWSYWASTWRLPNCLQLEGLPVSHEGVVMIAVRFGLGPLLVVVAKWSIDLNVISVILVFFVPHSWLLMNRSGVFLAKISYYRKGKCYVITKAKVISSIFRLSKTHRTANEHLKRLTSTLSFQSNQRSYPIVV
jgi:hypothetical protein